MNPNGRLKGLTILVADDDQDDQMLIRELFEDKYVVKAFHFVNNGQELLDYLNCKGSYSQPGQAPRPDIILLDLNMPKMDGREALRYIKSHPILRIIPIVVLSTSSNDGDLFTSYQEGANSFITKPLDYEALEKVVDALGVYWGQVANLPTHLLPECQA